MQAAAIEAGRQDHAFAEAETHLARRQVGDEHHAATHQRFRLAIGTADTREDLPRAEIAGVQFEAQQLVGAFHEFARQHLAHAQVEPGEVVDADELGTRNDQPAAAVKRAGLGIRGFCSHSCWHGVMSRVCSNCQWQFVRRRTPGRAGRAGEG